jgi:hypothetical protein
LTKNTTKEQVKEQFKLVTGLTAIEDIFVGLKQAEERQEIKDKIDAIIDPLRQYEFYDVIGLNIAYDNILMVLAHQDLKIKSTTGAECYYTNKTIFLQDNTVTYTIVHELVHAYNDMLYGGINRREDEMLAELMSGIFSLEVIRPLILWENLLNKHGVTEVELTDGWNALWYIDQDRDKSLPTKLKNVKSHYRNWAWEDPNKYIQNPTLANLIDLKKIYGIYFSQQAIRNYSNAKVPSGYTIPVEKSPFGHGY